LRRFLGRLGLDGREVRGRGRRSCGGICVVMMRGRKKGQLGGRGGLYLESSGRQAFRPQLLERLRAIVGLRGCGLRFDRHGQWTTQKQN